MTFTLGACRASIEAVQTAGWNHNIQYHPIVLRSVPDGAARALDVGCGEGLLSRRLRAQVGDVVAIDRHQASVDLARAQSNGDIAYVACDFMNYPLRPASFDFIASVASLHHMDVAAALNRMRTLLRPGGRLVVIGLARSSRPADWAVDAVAMFVNRVHKRSKREVEDGAPKVWPAPLTYSQTRKIARCTLPHAQYRRRLLWRYSLVWTAPG
jgi:SAM-dependent methyltransferase